MNLPDDFKDKLFQQMKAAFENGEICFPSASSFLGDLSGLPATNVPAMAMPCTLTLEQLKATHALLHEHPADEFDRRTAAGEKLNLITGEYERRVSADLTELP